MQSSQYKNFLDSVVVVIYAQIHSLCVVLKSCVTDSYSTVVLFYADAFSLKVF